ncbi:hypothetical protein EA472_12790 [Natrarchaeobius oligotrophus]|uniref:KaiC-like domain-containing protein n=1 Tax=Natrarchaeobius chitinivorans TaxID=1679083 RepID=A0A3N6PHI1_NATCH|nr:hypothetical protein EA472_12790 [Natrarchaeobius chitinivorans]
MDESVDLDTLPRSIPDGSVICVARSSPLTDNALPLRITERYAAPDDCRIIVTTATDADETIAQQNAITPTGEHRVGVIDTTADDHVESLYQEHPTISLARTGELTQITLALWDLEEALSTSCSTPHVIVRSLTPTLEQAGLERLTNVLESVIEHQRAAGSLTVFGIEYTAHDERTMAALETLVDGIVWVERTGQGDLELEYRRTHHR